MPKPDEERDLIRALARGLDMILAFSHHRSRMTLTEAAEATGLSRPTARRILLTLQDRGYVRTDGKTFALTPRVLALGYAYLSSLDLTEIAQPFMERVVETTGEGCSMATLDDTDVVYVTRVPTHRITSITLATGTRLPAHATSLGHVLLADLTATELDRYLSRADLRPLTARTIRTADELRERLALARNQGWAMVDQELEDGLRSIAAPVRDANGRVIAAMGLSSLIATTDADTVRKELLPPLLAASNGVSAELGDGVGESRAR
ncbi:IclR family transcriptional regulator domain-containing protein [Spirillospora sp. CA-255316]